MSRLPSWWQSNWAQIFGGCCSKPCQVQCKEQTNSLFLCPQHHKTFNAGKPRLIWFALALKKYGSTCYISYDLLCLIYCLEFVSKSNREYFYAEFWEMRICIDSGLWPHLLRKKEKKKKKALCKTQVRFVFQSLGKLHCELFLLPPPSVSNSLIESI